MDNIHIIKGKINKYILSKIGFLALDRKYWITHNICVYQNHKFDLTLNSQEINHSVIYWYIDTNDYENVIDKYIASFLKEEQQKILDIQKRLKMIKIRLEY